MIDTEFTVLSHYVYSTMLYLHCTKFFKLVPLLQGNDMTHVTFQNILVNVEHCGGEPEQADTGILCH